MNNPFSKLWTWVTVSGATGLLLGGTGAMYAPEAINKIKSGGADANLNPNENVGDSHFDTDLPVADVSDDMSFSEAFAAARAEVGPGGVFYWHGGIYGTYYKDEWDAMSDSEKAEFGEHAYEMFPESLNDGDAIRPQDVEVLQAHHVPQDEPQPVPPAGNGDHNSVIDEGPSTPEPTVINTGTYNGKFAAELDMDGDGIGDILYVDQDGSRDVSDADLIIDRAGNVETLGGDYLGTIQTDDNVDRGMTSGNPQDSEGPQVIDSYMVEGHMAAEVDMDGDKVSDVLVVDQDDSGDLSDNDIMIDRDGNVATLEGEYLGNVRKGLDMADNSEVNTDSAANDGGMTTNGTDDGDDEVHVIGYGEYDGHLTMELDTRGDGMTDSVIIDVDDDGVVSAEDILVTDEGDSSSLGDLGVIEAENNDIDDLDADNSVDGSDGSVYL